MAKNSPIMHNLESHFSTFSEEGHVPGPPLVSQRFKGSVRSCVRIFALIIPSTVAKNNMLSENIYFWPVLATIIKQVDFFHKNIPVFANARKMFYAN